jgi:hypothetical protein
MVAFLDPKFDAIAYADSLAIVGVLADSFTEFFISVVLEMGHLESLIA